MKLLMPLAMMSALMVAQGALATGLPRLHSTHAMVVDAATQEVLLDKDGETAAPIASVTKLLTAMVALDANPDLGETLSVTNSDVDTIKHSRSRVSVGTELSREDMLHLALMSSENRAASALSRHYAGGQSAFVSAMNAKARSLGMTGTRVEDPTGLSPNNQASARDLVRMVLAAEQYRPIKQFTTASSYKISFGQKMMAYKNTNPLVGRREWDIGLSKTGYTKEAGRCIVMKLAAAGKNFVVVLLGSESASGRMADIQSIKRWIAGEPQMAERAPRRAVLVAKHRRHAHGAIRLAKYHPHATKAKLRRA